MKVILTGATGMVGEGVFHECLQSPEIEAVLAIARKPCGVVHPKLKKIVHDNFLDLSSIEDRLGGYDACMFCLGVSAIGKTEAEYRILTHTLTLHAAETLCRLNAGMTFCYISGTGTDSTEKGNIMWARVKGRTENDLMKMPFKRVYAFRPGYLHPTPGLKFTQPYYKYMTWLYPVCRAVMPKYFCSLAELGRAMIRAALQNFPKKILEVTDIVALAKEIKI